MLKFFFLKIYLWLQDNVIHDEATEVIGSMLSEASLQDGEVKIDSTFNAPIINVLWQIVANTRFDPKDGETKKLMDMLNSLFR